MTEHVETILSLAPSETLTSFSTSHIVDWMQRDDQTKNLTAQSIKRVALTHLVHFALSNRFDLALIPRLAKHKMVVGMHNHSRMVPNEFATAENFATAMKEGPFIGINLDIGHFWAANFDAVPFMKEHHQHIVTVHIKDRKKNQGDNMPFGEGDTPIKEVLLQMKANKWKIPAMIEYEYKGADTVAEVKKCFEYCKAILTA